MTETIPLCVPSVGAEERELLERCIADNFVSSVGPFVTRFEEEFAAFCGAGHAVATSSGTTALHLAMVLAGLGPGDLVAVSDFTFIASANAVAYTGADILLVDSEPGSWNMDGQMLYDHVHHEAAAGRRIPSAVEAVHVLGHPVDLEPLLALRDEFGITLIEDAAEALGASFTAGRHSGRQAGTVSGLGAFSFNGNKIITTGSGGMLVTDDESVAARARHLTTQARLPGPDYFHDEVGFNYRMSNITAAVGLAQVRKLPGFIAAKRAIAAWYDELLDPEIVERPPSATFADPTYWLYTVLLEQPRRDRVLAHLRAQGIGARSVWPPLRTQKPYAHHPTLGEGCGASIFDRALSIPSSVDLRREDAVRVATHLNEAARGVPSE